MRETTKSFSLDSAKYRAVHVNLEVVVDGTNILHELREDLFCKDVYEIQLSIKRFNEAL